RDRRAYMQRLVWRKADQAVKRFRNQPDRHDGRTKMAKSGKATNAAAKSAAKSASKSRSTNGGKAHVRAVSKSRPTARMQVESGQGNWATDLVFDVREPKLAVSLRLDGDVLRFFRGFGGGYQTRINEVLKGFMPA